VPEVRVEIHELVVEVPGSNTEVADCVPRVIVVTAEPDEERVSVVK